MRCSEECSSSIVCCQLGNKYLQAYPQAFPEPTPLRLTPSSLLSCTVQQKSISSVDPHAQRVDPADRKKTDEDNRQNVIKLGADRTVFPEDASPANGTVGDGQRADSSSESLEVDRLVPREVGAGNVRSSDVKDGNGQKGSGVHERHLA
jgi:hypothetical protein